MAAHVTITRAGEHVPTADQRIVTYGVPWEFYEAQLALRGDRSAPRIAYLEGAMELMSPSKDHERIKSYIGRLIEAYALERGIDLSPYGGWTLKKAPKKSGVEPDECYLVGDQSRDTPDLAIEVIWTSGGLDKLEIYRRLGVGEVWIWKEEKIQMHVLRGDRYELTEKSLLFPGLDLQLLASFLDRPSALQAVKAFREALRA
jgi:Uma2 family endonuclease